MMTCRTLDWSIAGKHVQLWSDRETLPASWKTVFLFHGISPKDKTSPADIVIHATERSDFGEPTPPEVQVIHEEGHSVDNIRIHLPYADGTLCRDGLRCHGQFEINADSDLGIQLVTRLSLSLLAEEQGGILLHASGVWRDGEVWLFTGPSGAGKSTIANELRDRGEIFSEDLVLLRFADDTGSLRAYSTPFGTVRDTSSAPDSGQVAGIGIISQSTVTQVSSLANRKAAMVLFRESKWHARSSWQAIRSLEIIDKIINTGLCFALEFEKSQKLWSCLDESRRQGLFGFSGDKP